MKPTGRVLLAFATFMLSCSVDEIDHTDKACSAQKPCPGEWVCSDGRCKKPTGAPINDCKPSLLIADFRAEWRTPNSIRWAWTPMGEGADLLEYRLVLTQGADTFEKDGSDSLTRRAGDPDYDEYNTQIVTNEQNPELGQFELDDSTERDLVDFTITDSLAPGTLYTARVVALTSSCAYASNSYTESTANLRTTHDIFDDSSDADRDLEVSLQARPDEDAGADPPAAIKTDPVAPDDEYVWWQPESFADNKTKGWENVGLQQLELEASQIQGIVNDFDSAYLELSVDRDKSSSQPGSAAPYAEVSLVIATGCGQGPCCGGSRSTWTLRKLVFGDHQIVQAPLSHFQTPDETASLTASEFDPSNRICEIRVGSVFSLNEVVRLDDISLNY